MRVRHGHVQAPGDEEPFDEDAEFAKALQESKEALQKGSAYLQYHEQNLGAGQPDADMMDAEL